VRAVSENGEVVMTGGGVGKRKRKRRKSWVNEGGKLGGCQKGTVQWGDDTVQKSSGRADKRNGSTEMNEHQGHEAVILIKEEECSLS